MKDGVCHLHLQQHRQMNRLHIATLRFFGALVGGVIAGRRSTVFCIRAHHRVVPHTKSSEQQRTSVLTKYNLDHRGRSQKGESSAAFYFDLAV